MYTTDLTLGTDVHANLYCTPTVVQGMGGGGVVATPPLGFWGVTIFGKSFFVM